MAIIASGKSTNFVPCPEGTQQAVCADVVDLGVIETAFGAKHKVDVVWQSAELMENDKPFLVKKRYTLSLNEKANLRHDLESWRGKAFTEIELDGFDLEKLIGVNALVNVVHKKGSKGGVFANVVSVMPLARSMPKIAVSEYVRVQDRVTEPEPGEMSEASDEPPFGREEIPF